MKMLSKLYSNLGSFESSDNYIKMIKNNIIINMIKIILCSLYIVEGKKTWENISYLLFRCGMKHISNILLFKNSHFPTFVFIKIVIFCFPLSPLRSFLLLYTRLPPVRELKQMDLRFFSNHRIWLRQSLSNSRGSDKLQAMDKVNTFTLIESLLHNIYRLSNLKHRSRSICKKSSAFYQVILQMTSV